MEAARSKKTRICNFLPEISIHYCLLIYGNKYLKMHFHHVYLYSFLSPLKHSFTSRCGNAPLDHLPLNRITTMRKRYRYCYLIYHKAAVVALSPLICHWVNAHSRSVTWSYTHWIFLQTKSLCTCHSNSLSYASSISELIFNIFLREILQKTGTTWIST